MSASGITPVLIIDGQQRITTVTLLLIALAEYAREHAQAVESGELAFSYDEILDDKFLVNKYKRGDDHYRLTLSQGDEPVLRALLDRMEDPERPIDLPEESRLVNNLELYRKRLATVAKANSVWLGIHRLQVVSVSLEQGIDNPQLIFESMNATGKSLSTADLIRNFVLMSQTAEEQERLYENHWRVIERTLGQDYNEVFDEFIRNWLTALYAPEPLVRRDVYALFKRHVAEKGYDSDGRIVELLGELERYARYYAAITEGRCSEPALKKRLDRIARFGASVANPLLLSFWNDYENGAFDLDDFAALLDTLESYLFRRAVCDIATNSLNKFFSSLIARLARARDEGGNYLEAFQAMLLNEAGTARRFPEDAEFTEALRTRNCYGFRRSLYLLSRLENSYHPKDERDFSNGVYTIEHIMPQNALAHDEWLEMLGPDADELHARLVHTLGNLTLTAYNTELSDGTFAQKKERAIGGYDNEFISISSCLREADTWNADSIETRGAMLAARALEIWPAPQLAPDAQVETQGGMDGWTYWILEDGRKLDTLRREFAGLQPIDSSDGNLNDTEMRRAAYWEGFCDYASEIPAFVEAFGDPLERKAVTKNYMTFSIGIPGCQPIARIESKRSRIGLSVGYGDMETYAKIHDHVGEFEALATELDADFQADDVDDAGRKKTRCIYFYRSADYDGPYQDELYAWHATGLLRLRALILNALG